MNNYQLTEYNERISQYTYLKKKNTSVFFSLITDNCLLMTEKSVTFVTFVT